ncbi:MAG: hypothetical protein O7J95_13950 [Planctomycetota bacterium]|nr:hypothetical protein [Planctomycetota bacterium]
MTAATDDRQPLFFVLLGASNLSLGLPQAVGHILDTYPDRDLRIFVAHGPGRSYGVEAGLLGIRFVGLFSSGIFDAALREKRSVSEATGREVDVRALLTDIGNDVMYQTGVERLLDWVNQSVEKLHSLGARVAATSLPVESIESIPIWKYRIVRPLLFPFRPQSLSDVIEQVHRVQRGLEAAHEEGRVHLLPTRKEWYGFDPIHLRRRSRKEAFSRWIDALVGAGRETEATEDSGPGGGVPPLSRRAKTPAARSGLQVSSLKLRLRRPAEYLWLGRRRRGPPEALAVGPRALLYVF